MSYAEYYFTSLYFFSNFFNSFLRYYEKTNLWSYHNYKNTSKNRSHVLTNAFKIGSKIEITYCTKILKKNIFERFLKSVFITYFKVL